MFNGGSELPTFTGNKAITGSLTIGTTAILNGDAANTLALRNGVNAQQFYIYNTFTDTSNYERLEIGYGGNTATIATGKAGSGQDRVLRLASTSAVNIDGAGINFRLTDFVVRWAVDTGGNFIANGNRNIWIGASALATTATSGFLGVNSCAGPPTGVPASIPTGQIPLVWDSTNLQLCAYTGGAWKKSAVFT